VGFPDKIANMELCVFILIHRPKTTIKCSKDSSWSHSHNINVLEGRISPSAARAALVAAGAVVKKPRMPLYKSPKKCYDLFTLATYRL
jgi:hypothetical protein